MFSLSIKRHKASVLIVREIECRSVLNRSALADYCINPYIGCQHGCKYCYAESYTRRFTKHKELWGSFIDVKINAPTILTHEIKKKPRGEVYISSLTDAYQPLEQKYELTRKLLEILLKHQFSITIQTKSALVLRDLDIIKKFSQRQIGFTITATDDNIRKTFEPMSSTVEQRLQALEELRANRVKTYAFFGPVLPYLSDQNLEETLHTIRDTGVDYIYVDKLNLKPGLWQTLNSFIDKEHKDLHSQWTDIFIHKNNNYYADLKPKIDSVCKQLNLEARFCY